MSEESNNSHDNDDMTLTNRGQKRKERGEGESTANMDKRLKDKETLYQYEKARRHRQIQSVDQNGNVYGYTIQQLRSMQQDHPKRWAAMNFLGHHDNGSNVRYGVTALENLFPLQCPEANLPPPPEFLSSPVLIQLWRHVSPFGQRDYLHHRKFLSFAPFPTSTNSESSTSTPNDSQTKTNSTNFTIIPNITKTTITSKTTPSQQHNQNPPNTCATTTTTIYATTTKQPRPSTFSKLTPSPYQPKYNNNCHSSSTLEARWNERFEQLKDFQQKNGNCLVPKKYAANPPLAAWVQNQRRQYAKRLTIAALNKDNPNYTHKPGEGMSDERVAKLQTLGFAWISSTDGKTTRFTPEVIRSWQESFERLKKFKSKYGHCNVAQSYADDPKLGRWVKRQRRAYDDYHAGRSSPFLTEERIHLLLELGFQFRYQLKQSKVPWTEMLGRLKSYASKYGHTNVPWKWSGNLGLADWVDRQREEYRRWRCGLRSKMNRHRAEAIEKVGFVWRLHGKSELDHHYLPLEQVIDNNIDKYNVDTLDSEQEEENDHEEEQEEEDDDDDDDEKEEEDQEEEIEEEQDQQVEIEKEEKKQDEKEEGSESTSLESDSDSKQQNAADANANGATTKNESSLDQTMDRDI